MTSADPSLDERIWAYLRGESSQAERKQFEVEVSEDPGLARRYAALALKHQRQKAKLESSDESPLHLPKKSPEKRGHAKTERRLEKTAAKSDAANVLIFILALLLFAFSSTAYLLRGNWNAETLAGLRDGLHLAALLLASAMIVFLKHCRIWMLIVATLCIALSAGLAVLLASA